LKSIVLLVITQRQHFWPGCHTKKSWTHARTRENKLTIYQWKNQWKY